MMRLRSAIVILAAVMAGAGALLAAGVQGAMARALVVDLSNKEIGITANFSGTELLLFGAVEGKGDIAVVVRGPKRREVVRRKGRIAGIWINTDSLAFENVPAFYWIATTRKLEDMAPPALLASLELGERRLKIVAQDTSARAKGFHDALLRNKRKLGLFGGATGRVKILEDRLFRTSVTFPANVPTGIYKVEVFLFRNNRLIGSSIRPLLVHKAGIEAEIFNFAYQHAAWYGIIAIVIALMAGWAAGMVFRKA
jgi:uncharacterized protein (TIGR02186 family)